METSYKEGDAVMAHDNSRVGQTAVEEKSRNMRQIPTHGAAVLIVGDMEQWHGAKSTLLSDIIFTCVNYRDVDQDFFRDHKPSVVVSPLFCDSFDCVEVAEILHKSGFAGRYRVMGNDLPNPEVIRSEIKNVCPSVDFEIVRPAPEPVTMVNYVQ